MIIACNNVFLDEASDHKWEDLNESLYLTRFFESLREQMGHAFFLYNFHILSSHNPQAVPVSAAMPGQRKILFFISDESPSIPTKLSSHYLAIFKSYLPAEIPESNIYPFNIGYVREVPDIPAKSVGERSVNVFFSGNLNSNRLALYRELHPILKRLPMRIARSIFDRLNQANRRRFLRMKFSSAFPRSRIEFTDGFKAGLAPDEYARLLSDSKIAFCPKGFQSSETFRHIESIRAGCVVISEPLPDTHFYLGSPIVIVADWRAGVKTAGQVLKDSELLDTLRRRTLDWWRDVCSETATAKYVAQKLQQLEGSNGC
jgi:hypothetical protein